jgi:hypothetical protein
VASDGYTGAAAATPHRTTLLRYKHRYNLELTDGTFRGQSFDLVKVWKKPMCTTPAGGYFVASTARERDQHARQLYYFRALAATAT